MWGRGGVHRPGRAGVGFLTGHSNTSGLRMEYPILLSFIAEPTSILQGLGFKPWETGDSNPDLSALSGHFSTSS